MIGSNHLDGGMLESLFEFIPQPLCVIDTDGRLLRVNPAWETVLGYRPEELEGARLIEFMHPDDLESGERAMASALAGEAVLDFEVRTRTKAGAYRLLSWSAQSGTDGRVFATAREAVDDPTLTRKLELELQRDLLSQTESTAGIGSWRVDLATMVGTQSDGLYKILGIEREPSGQHITEIGARVVHPADRDLWNATIEAVQAGRPPASVDLRFIHPSGAVRWGHLRAAVERGPDGTAVALVGFVQDVTERKEAELALAASEHLLSVSQKVARVGHYTFDAQADSWEGSEILYDLWGIGPEYHRDFESWLGLCHPDDREMMRLYVTEEVLERGHPFDKQYRVIRPSDGACRWMYGHGNLELSDDGHPTTLFGVIQDITDLKVIEQRFRSERDQLSAIMEMSAIGIIFVDADGRMTMANRRAEEVLGLGREDITALAYDAPGWHAKTLKGEPLPPEAYPIARALATGMAVHDVRHGIEWPDGRRVILSVSATPLKRSDGKITGVVAVFDDITEAVRVNEEIRDLNEDLEGRVHERTAKLESAMHSLATMNVQLEEASEAKTRLLSNMSHELRTPLNSVIGFSTILLQGMAGPLNDEQARQIQMIKRGGQALLSLVNDILDLSRVEAGVTQLECSDFAVDEVLGHLVESMRPSAEERGLTLSLVQTCPGLTMHCDQGKVSQILLNLMSNAVKFTDSGSVEVSCEAGEEDVWFRVKDTGIGIPQEEISLIMEDFHQVDRIDDGMKPAGTGLGLAISWRLAEMMGGSLSVQSRLGEGSTFTLLVPIQVR